LRYRGAFVVGAAVDVTNLTVFDPAVGYSRDNIKQGALLEGSAGVFGYDFTSTAIGLDSDEILINVAQLLRNELACMCCTGGAVQVELG
jgi:hypothetical protein